MKAVNPNPEGRNFTELETLDTIFKLYHSRNLALPLQKWTVLTNIPGDARSASIPMTIPMDFFVLTVSNYRGESGYATH